MNTFQMLGGAAGFGDKQMCEVEVQGKEVHNEEEGLIMRTTSMLILTLNRHKCCLNGSERSSE